MNRLNSLGIAKAPSDTRVVAAMSGGVDSSVVAALLQQQGYDVIGVTLQLYDHGAANRKRNACCAGQDVHDARRVAAQLDIPHYVLDYEERFRRRVIDDFAAEYAKGLTPIPCIRCNERVKFADLLEMAGELGADALATGHYVRRIDGVDGPELHCARDGTRDQSYFLFRTTKKQLASVRFPLGDLDKKDVRRLASELGLGVAGKPDSQDICFVPDGNYARLVEQLMPETASPGEIVDEEGRVLGSHDGVIHFTVGQRKRLGISGTTAPLYVLALDAKRRRVVVGPRAALRVRTIDLTDVNWLVSAGAEVDCGVKVRSSHPPVAARVRRTGDATARVELPDGESGVAPGQACVFYEGTRMLGGGWIGRTESVSRAA